MKIYLSFQALFLMNVHAHLFKSEIIGYTSGYVVKEGNSQMLFSYDALMCQPLGNIDADRTKTVEMDPDSGSMAMMKAAERGQDIVGWYHSHPTFEVSPSNIDVENHKAYHELFANDQKPFVGFIVGPYYKDMDIKRGMAHSLQKCFHLKVGEEYKK